MSGLTFARKLFSRVRGRSAKKIRLTQAISLPRIFESLERRDVMAAAVFISEVHPAGSGNGTYGADWFEVTNTGASNLNITGWKMDDNSNSFATSVGLRGLTTIPAGKSAVFFEGNATGSTDATIIANFSTAWFGSAIPPAGFLIGAYGGSGVGLSTSGDAVNLFDAGGNRVTGVNFGAANSTVTFDNTAGLGSTTLPLPTVSTFSAAGVNGAFVSSNGAETGSPGRTITGVDLSTYVRVGRFDLPEPTRTIPPANSLLAQEVSAVTYNWDTNTLFVVGDGSTSIVQVTKTGQLIDSMTLAPGGSPQGTEFYDTEGLTYVGGGKFVMVEERDRQAVLFTYVAGTTLNRGDAQTVDLGTFAPNIGIEGMSYDPQTSGFIAVKETQPQGVFQTGIDFSAGTATNGSATTENSTNLFDPVLANLLDFADVFALSNLSTLNGQADSSHLLVLSQESGQIVNIDRFGNISNSLTIVSDPGNPLSVPAQQHEGLTMDPNGYLYVVSENGGGDFDHPQLWVYAPSSVPNLAPTAITLINQVNSIVENTSTVTRIKVADVAITDDGLGTNNLTVTGADASFFEVDSTGLYIKAGTTLDFETKSSYSVSVNVDDPTLGGSSDASASFSLSVTDVINEDPSHPSLFISEVAPWSSGNSPVGADWFEITNSGNSPVNISGWKMDDNSNSFAAAVTLNGITSIAPGESVIFIETSNLASLSATFRSNWFGANPPLGLQIGNYTGGGVGLGTGGDAVNLYDSSGALLASVSFGASPTGAPFATFDNAAALNNTSISQLSAVRVHGGFVAVNSSNEIGSPGTVGRLFISEVSPWSSGNSPVGADWFEVTNGTAQPIDISGWKFDDSSGSFAASVALNGITVIAPGESVIFLESANLASVSTAFRSNWFGAFPPAGLQIGNYTGGGVGLSTGGDEVNLYNSTGVLQARVAFGISPIGPFSTFDNADARNNTTISQLSVVAVNGAFTAINDASEVGSPGTIFKINRAPTSVALNNQVNSLPENASTTLRIKVADVSITDPEALGTNVLSLSGTDTASFELDGSVLYLKAGTVLNFEVQANYAVTVNLDDAAVGGTPDATANFSLAITDVNEVTTAVNLTNTVTTLPENTSTAVRIKVADVGIVDDALGTNVLSLSGADATRFELDGNALYLKAGTILNFEVKPSYAVTVNVDDSTIGATPDASTSFNLAVSDGSNVQPFVFVASDPLHPGSSAFYVVGTSQDDHIKIKGKNSGQFEVDIDATGVDFSQNFTGPFSRIVIYGLAGDDHIQADDQTATETWMFAGAGDDHLQGGKGSNLLVGGTGDDHLQAGRGRDVLIGGLGSDHLQSGQGEDILIAGTTDYDTNDAALAAILAEWGSATSYLSRVSNLQSMSFTYRLNSSTVHDDHEVDQLQGGQSLDWFLAHLSGNMNEKDKASSQNGEVLTGI